MTNPTPEQVTTEIPSTYIADPALAEHMAYEMKSYWEDTQAIEGMISRIKDEPYLESDDFGMMNLKEEHLNALDNARNASALRADSVGREAQKRYEETNPIINFPGKTGARIEQMSTRGDGSIELGEAFRSDSMDFSQALTHIGIHTEGTVAGSQFNGEVFETAEAVIEKIKTELPEDFHYDQHGRAELTLCFKGEVVGYSGIRSKDELLRMDGVRLTLGMRIPGGEASEVEGKRGAWYPEMARNPETNSFEVAVNSDGSVKNPHGKFEPEALIAYVEEGSLPQVLSTEKVTVIVQKNPENGLPTVLTVFPGENAPAFPAKIETEAFQTDTLQDGSEAAFWSEHAFLKSVVQ